jgi:hypothetical protein
VAIVRPCESNAMSNAVDDLLARIHALREELELEFQKRREEIGFIIQGRRVRFTREMLETHRLYRVGLLRYLRGSRWAVVLTAPLIYSGFIVFGLMDLFVTLYQALCFPVYGIARVRRRDHLVFDRGDLPYLNLIERFNCFYCSYANGVAAYLREVAARTEQYWCPIKHARRVLGPHDRYPVFFEYGDAEAFRKGLERLRSQYADDA